MMKHALISLVCLIPFLNCHAELPATEPIIVPEKGLLEKDHQALRLKWAETKLLPDAEKRWQGKAWSQKASAVTTAGFKLWFGLSPTDDELMKKLVLQADDLMKSGCEEPLACLMAQKILFWPNKDWRVSDRSSTHSFKIVDDPSYLAALRVWIVDERIDLLKQHHRSINESYQDKQAARIAEAIKDGSYSSEFEPVLVRDFIDWLGNIDELEQSSFELLKTSIETSPHSEWAKETILADLEVRWAWRIRGGHWAHLVKEDSWKGFVEHLELASKHAEKAYELRPDRPEAPSKMLIVHMGLSSGPIKLREWFDRAIKAQFDYAGAYVGLANACSTRWGGNDEMVLALGCRFAETNRYDTDVPTQLFYACKRIAIERADARSVFSHPQVKEAVIGYAKAMLDQPEAEPSRTLRNQSLAAISAWLAGDDALAAAALKKTRGRIDIESARDLSAMLHHVDGMKTSVLAGSGMWGEEMKTLEQLYRRQDARGLQQTLLTLSPDMVKDQAGKDYLAEIRAVVELPQKLAKGGWQPLPVYPGLATCLSTGGDWRVTGPGEITFTGSDDYHRDLAFPLLSSEFLEFRGKISLELPPEKSWYYHWAFTPVIHWQPERFATPGSASGVRGILYQLAGKPPEMALSGRFFTKRIGAQEVTIKPVNTFHLSAEGSKANYAFNGIAMPPQDLATLNLEVPRGLVGLTGIYIPMGGKLIIRDLEVRTVKGI
jgi:hypothetical protein